jgi:hypothetical protein
MALGQIGLLTSAAETLATAVGAGMLLGSFGVGTFLLLTGKSRQDLEGRVLSDGYYGGILGILLVATDLVLGYG